MPGKCEAGMSGHNALIRSVPRACACVGHCGEERLAVVKWDLVAVFRLLAAGSNRTQPLLQALRHQGTKALVRAALAAAEGHN